MIAMRILIIEDDALVADGMRAACRRSVLPSTMCRVRNWPKRRLQQENFDLLLVDLGLPGCRRLRTGAAPAPQRQGDAVLIVTARDALGRSRRRARSGRRRLPVKPFALPELAARCRALIRRSKSNSDSGITIGPLHLDIPRRETRVQSRAVDLTRREWAILECLALHAGQVVSKDRLQQAISSWDEGITTNAVEVYISRLRGKLGEEVGIRTVRGLGYRLDESVA
jgi:DNA-binding response OmpR family regulator